MAEILPTYLETFSDRNVGFYRRRGYASGSLRSATGRAAGEWFGQRG